ncbi:MAG: hypothetical protein KKD69_06725 [Euryarchaeota archaeon]|nr:hypothetical protein [Euryarchaeota archaeon]MBU4492140.1 hypothetical protein [Euryarchaeota archaeon]MCG2727342.1 PGF-CTERM sorting domain-containing protein [Candidatus Methanoperedenaceae archaeon]
MRKTSTSDGGAASKTPGFAGELAIIGILFVALFIRRRKI